MNKNILIKSLCLSVLVFSVAVIVKADPPSSNVTATVEIGAVTVNISHSDFDYGSLPYGGVKTSFDVLAENNMEVSVGGVETDLDIKGADTTDWTLAGSSSEDQYIHKFGLGADQTNVAGSYTALTTNYTELSSEVTAGSSVWLGLEITAPSSGESEQQSAIVTVQATWSGE